MVSIATDNLCICPQPIDSARNYYFKQYNNEKVIFFIFYLLDECAIMGW